MIEAMTGMDGISVLIISFAAMLIYLAIIGAGYWIIIKIWDWLAKIIAER